nr:hypothetical protein [Tanacetum cinerariifolium]
LANADGNEAMLAAVYRPPSPTRRFLRSTLLASISFCVSGSMSWFSLSSDEALHEILKPWVRVLEMNANCLDGTEVNEDVKGTSVEDIVGEKRALELMLLKSLKKNTKCFNATGEELSATKHKLMLLIYCC